MLTEINLEIKIKYPSKLLKLFSYCSITELFPFKLIIPQPKEKAAIRHKTGQKFWGCNFTPPTLLNPVLEEYSKGQKRTCLL